MKKLLWIGLLLVNTGCIAEFPDDRRPGYPDSHRWHDDANHYENDRHDDRWNGGYYDDQRHR